MKDIRQTSDYARYLSSTGWKVEKIDNTYIFIKHLPILGLVIKIQRPQKLEEKQIKLLIKKHKPFQIIVEPKTQDLRFRIQDLGFKQTAPFLPSRTVVLDLTKSEKALFNTLAKDCKYALRKNLELIIKNVELKDLENFRKAWVKAVPRSRYVPSLSHLQFLKKAFGEKALFLQAGSPRQSANSATAGAIFLIGDNTAYYWMAFTNKTGRKKLHQYKIVWEGILWAKKQNCKFFDFEGIYDDRFPNKSWKGFTHFKKSFGGEDVTYPGAFTKYLPTVNFNFSKRTQKLLSALFIVMAVAALVFSLTQTKALISIANQHPLLAPFLIILWRIVGVVIPPIPGGLLALAMIPVFGWFLAFLYGAIGLIVGCVIAFWLARIFGEKIVSPFISLKQLHRFEDRLSKSDEFFAFLLIRFTTGAVLDFVSYVAGLTKISFKTFFIATVISVIPDALYYYLGGAIYSKVSPEIILFIGAIIVILYLISRKRVK